MLTKALKLHADQKQMKILHNYFDGNVTICMYPLPPCHFLSLILSNLERNHEKENKIKKIKKLCVIKETCHETWEFISAIYFTPTDLF